jgi:hypothetical protein
VTEHVTTQVPFLIPAVGFRVPVKLSDDSRGGGSRSRSFLAAAALRGWYDSATKWAVVVGNGRVAPALSSAPTETPNVRFDRFNSIQCISSHSIAILNPEVAVLSRRFSLLAGRCASILVASQLPFGHHLFYQRNIREIDSI